MARRTPPRIRALLTYTGQQPQDRAPRKISASQPGSEVVAYWERESVRWRRHAARFEALAADLRRELGSFIPTTLRRPACIDLRSNRYWWFTHMAAVYGSWASRAEQRLRVLQETRPEPS